MALSVSEREQFLAEPHVAALSVSAEAGRAPLVVPIWYQYTPGGELWILTQPESRKALLIQQAGRFSLLVDRTSPSVRYVSVEGPVTRILPETDGMIRELARRYLPAEQAQQYEEFHRTQLGEHVAIYLDPARWLSTDLG